MTSQPHAHTHDHAAHPAPGHEPITGNFPALPAVTLHPVHAHAHGFDASIPRSATPAASLLRMSLPQRLAIALGLTGLIWLAVFWALTPS